MIEPYAFSGARKLRGLIYGNNDARRDAVIYVGGKEEELKGFCDDWNHYCIYSPGRSPDCEPRRFDRGIATQYGSDRGPVPELIESLRDGE